MPIDLGLNRIKKLLSYLGNPHVSSYKSIHVAGTNGKGSTIAYLSSILTQSKIRNGRFTSPHLISYNDCISINERTYPMVDFEKVRMSVLNQDSSHNLGCTEFEILTATAFKIFEIEQVDLALIEVGLGGRLDATNVLIPPVENENSGGVVVCGITKIGMDHEGFLGDSLSAIAKEKAGIIKNSLPVVVDHSNEQVVLDVISNKAQELNAQLIYSTEPSRIVPDNPIHYSPLLGDYQSVNLSVALKIIDVIKDKFPQNSITHESVVSGIRRTNWPGRLQKLEDDESGIHYFLDGAHNECASMELGNYLNGIRKNGFIFVVAMSQGKSVENLLKHIAVKEQDALIPFQFSHPLEMPWVKSYSASHIAEVSSNFVAEVLDARPDSPSSLFQCLSARKQIGDFRQIVICGSLYLCSDILRHAHATKYNSPHSNK